MIVAIVHYKNVLLYNFSTDFGFGLPALLH